MSQIIPFKQDEYARTYTVPPSTETKGYLFLVETKEKKSLRLAEAEDFFSICETSLWGNEDRREFGEMLRALVVGFLPENRWDLLLLAQVADAQWGMLRMRKLQQAIFVAGENRPGADGVSAKTLAALNYDGKKDLAFIRLEKAIKIYRSSKSRSLD